MELNATILKQTYIDWVRDVNYTDIGDNWIEIQTPFTNIYGDMILLFIRKIDNRFHLTDYGNTINELSLSDINLSKPQSAELKHLAMELTQLFKTKALIQGDDYQGRIVIEYYNKRDLERIVAMLLK